MDPVMALVAAVAFVSGLLLREFLPGYMREKGKNLATKEDVTEITDLIESVRHGYSVEMERMRVDLRGGAYEREVRFARPSRATPRRDRGVVQATCDGTGGVPFPRTRSAGRCRVRRGS